MNDPKSIDLNIIDRGLDGQEWTSERGKITRDDLHKIHEQKTGNGGALNALPTPFARFFVFREAFRRVLEERLEPQNEAGLAYERLVSDCLDVYELLFNLQFHRNHWNNRRDIVIREWNYEENMANLKRKMPVLYNAVNSYYPTDIHLPKLFFILLRENGKEKLLATSSPITGFVTPPDMDRKDVREANNTFRQVHMGERYEGMNLPRRSMESKRNRDCYFGAVELFDQRPVDFKNYMYQMFSREVAPEMDEMKKYILSFGDTDVDIRIDYKPEWIPVESENNEKLEFSGITVCSSNAVDVNKFFTDCLLKIPYAISKENFYVPEMEGKKERDYGYLLPFTDYALGVINVEGLTCRIKELTTKVVVSIHFKGHDYQKEYKISPLKEGEGRIIDFKNALRVNLELGLFPNVKSSVRKENNYYKLMLVAADENEHRTFDIHETTCDFYAPQADESGNRLIEKATSASYNSGMRTPVVRSEQTDDVACSTKFFEVFNSEISAINLHLSIEGHVYSGVLIPRFHVQSNPTRVYTYAIDFGTSNTYISKRLKGNNFEPEQLSMSDTMMSYLHAVKASSQQNLVDLCEEIPFKQSADFFHTEFVPPFIDGTRYKFPLRTAMVKTKKEQQEGCLFDDHNIAFSYEKHKVVGNHEVSTNLKWNEDLTEARLFIRELLMVVKYDALLSDAFLSRTEIVWFFPLSFSRSLKQKYMEIWYEEAREVLGIPAEQVRVYTESEAPYYYYSEKDVFQSIDSVAVLDIGGGSTDMVYFKEGKPQIANSVHFGCDVLWGNGFNKMVNARDNGVYNRYKDILSFGNNEELNELNAEMCRKGSVASTRDIINFWIANSRQSKIGNEHFASLLRNECKPLFLYHYASIIFYMATLFKVRGLDCPNAVAFSGNGSRYIDGFISSDINVLTDLTMVILRAVYGEEVRRVQLILRDCRKESTCYGGLYRDSNQSSAEPVLFQGVDGKEYDNVAELTHDYQEGTLRSGIIQQMDELNSLYMKMLRLLVQKEELVNVNTLAVEAELAKGCTDALDKNFKEEVRDKLASDVQYRDSLFFLPVIDKVTKLTLVQRYIK